MLSAAASVRLLDRHLQIGLSARGTAEVDAGGGAAESAQKRAAPPNADADRDAEDSEIS